LKIAVIGAGIVGKASGIGLESKGHDVTFADNSPARLDELKSSGHKVDSSVPDVTRSSHIVMVSVPTPTVSGRTDLQALLSVGEEIGLGLTDSPGYKLVVVRSTVPPRTTRRQFIPVLEALSRKRPGRDFGVCFNPEFLRENSALEDFLLPYRIVVGQLDQHSGTMLESLYESFQKPVLRCTLEEAELAKYVANAFLATKISYFNEVHEVCKALGVSSEIVSSIAALDERIGRYGTIGGRPFKGRCLPKDVEAFLTFARDLDIRLEVLKAAMSVNQNEPLRHYA
jgi:nucleotide sugar dehydrogenase